MIMRVKLPGGRRSRGSAKGGARISKVADWFHYYASAEAAEKINQGGGKVLLEVEADDASQQPLAVHLTPSPNGDCEFRRPRTGSPYIPIPVHQFGLSAASCRVQEVEETITETEIVVKVPREFCPRE
jgi:hypothetical protein